MQPPAGTFTRGEKGRLRNPINHLLEVASLVAEATQGKNPKVIIAALLHDAIEDQEVPRGLIAQEFGEEVAALVEEVTDDKSLEKHQRKRKQVETANKKSDDAKRIKLADKTSNLRAIAIRQFDDGLMVFLCYHLSSTAARQPAPRLPCPSP